jgi:TonB family protein
MSAMASYLAFVLSLAPSVSAQARNAIPSTQSASAGAPQEGSAGLAVPSYSFGFTVLSDTQGIDFSPYLQKLRKRVVSRWFALMPMDAKFGKKGKVGVVIKIHPDGALAADDLEVETQSGAKVLDKAAVDAIRTATPFEPLPPDFHGPYLRLRMVFLYNERFDPENQKEVQTSVTVDQRIDGTTYINRTAHFTLTVPRDWHVTDALIRTTPNVIGTVAAPRGGAAIMIQRYDYPFSPEQSAHIVERGFSEGFPGYHRLDDTPIKIGGEDAPSFTFEFEGPPGTQAHLPGKMLVVLIRNEGSVLGLMCEAPDPLFDQIENTFKEIVTSYHYSTAP